MFEQKFIPIEEYRNATQKNEDECLYTKHGGDNKRIVEKGTDFIKC